MGDFTAEADTLHIRKSKANRTGISSAREGVVFPQRTAGRMGFDLLRRPKWKKANQSDPMKAACKRAKIEPVVGFISCAIHRRA